MLIPTTCFNCESACGLLAHVAKDDLTITKLEGNPAHPGSRGRNCAKGPATINQVDDPERILYPLRQAGPRGSGQWERVSWDEALDDIAARIRHGDRRGPAQRGDVPRRPAGRGRLRRALPAGLGGRRPQLAHQHLLVGRSARLLPLGRLRPTVAGPRQQQGDPAAVVAPRDGPLLQPARAADHGGEGRRAPSWSSSTRGCPTPPRTPTCGWRPGRAARRRSCSSVAAHLLRTRQIDAEFIRRWVNWDVYLQRLHPDAEPTFEVFLDRLEADYAPYTFELAAAEARVPREPRSRSWPTSSRRRVRRCRRTSGAPRPPGNLGGWQVARSLFFLNVLTGSVGTVGRHQPERVEQVHRPRLRRARRATRELERAALAARVSAVLQRDVVPAAAFPQRGQGPARGLLLAGLQPDLDQPGRLHAGWRR